MVTNVKALAFVLQATRLCAGGKTVLEPVAVITQDCSNMWHVLKVQVIPYYMGLRDHGMEDRRVQLLLLEKPECHPVSLSEKDSFLLLFEVLSAAPPPPPPPGFVAMGGVARRATPSLWHPTSLQAGLHMAAQNGLLALPGTLTLQ